MKQQLWMALLAVVLVASVGCVQVQVPPTTAARAADESGPDDPGEPGAKQAEKEGEQKDEDKKDEPFKPWDEVLKDTEAADGFFRTHLKRDQTLLLELPPERLDEDFGLAMHYSRGTGVFNIQDGLYLGDTHLMRFRRVGDKVYLVHRNPRFRAEPGSPMETSMADNVGHSIAAAFDIKSEHETSKHLLLDVTGFFVSDYADVAERIKPYYDDKRVALDDKRSFLSRIQSFPKNLELDVELTFTADHEPEEASTAGITDYRSIPVGVRYSLFALPEEPMQPRFADTRLGFFIHAFKDFSRDQEESPYARYIRRWRLEKKDPAAEMSEPVQPIVYWIDRSVPEEYREAVRRGIEDWSLAFEAAGFKNAVVAKVAPSEAEDPTWSAEDMRYSTVRWTAAHSMGYAIGPSQVDPRTGEILNADILISYTFVPGWLYTWQELGDPRPVASPAAPGEERFPANDLRGMVQRHVEMERQMMRLTADERSHLCLAEMGKARELGLQHALMVGMGRLQPGEPMPREYLDEAIRDLVLHEVGHTLGLRHNFKSSAGTPVDRLHDTSFTGTHGVSVSVMDYTPVNMALDPDEQGHYWNPVPGSYDRWVIRYGYAPVYEQPEDGPFAMSGTLVTSPEAEKPYLAKVARLGADPLHTYGTDEDNWIGPFAVDPLTNAWDLGADPLAYAEQRVELVRTVKPRLEEQLIQEGEGYDRLRAALFNVTFSEWAGLSIAVRTVGGLYFARDHKGDPNQRPPFTPVSAERQRRALRLVAETAFTADAFELSPSQLNHMAPNRWAHWGSNFFTTPVDVAVHEQILFLQGMLLDNLLHPARLNRILNNEVRMPRGQEPFRLSEMMDTLTVSIWRELDAGADVPSVRRNLQRLYVDALVSLLMDEGGSTPVLPDARSLARWQLDGLATRIGEVLAGGSGLDVYTRAHLAESRARIERALEASLTVAP